MRLLLLNPPHTAIGSRIPVEHLPPLGLLYIGGAIIDCGYRDISLLDADYSNMPITDIINHVKETMPNVLLIGHSGSTSAHPTIVKLTKKIKSILPSITIIYGGVYPSYHTYEILKHEPSIDFIVRGEGEAIIQKLIPAIDKQTPYEEIDGIAYRQNGRIVITPQAPLIKELDTYRIGWELIDLNKYSYWGEKRAVVIQFSRGCPHHCSYCGQKDFWEKWRHRDPKKLAQEMAMLHRKHGVEVFNLADENPTSSKKAWRAFLEAIIAEDIDITIVASTRTDDIVRDEDILHLYKQAGVARFLLGIENYDESTLIKIKKGTTIEKDRKAIQLLRQYHILSMATYVFGFEEERLKDYWGGLKKIISYDPDQIQMLYATPHKWTAYYQDVKHREVIQEDMKKWDYKHQVLATKYISPFVLFVCVKTMEIILQMRPRSLVRLLFYPDKKIRDSIRWYYRVGRKVWFYEVFHFFFRDRRTQYGMTLEKFLDSARRDNKMSIQEKR